MEQTVTTINEYIAQFPLETQAVLNQLRETIRAAAPEATEKISWGMATFVLHGNLVHFSAQKQHIGFHPAPSGIEAFREELHAFECSKGTVRLPFGKPLPIDLIRKIVQFRVDEQNALALAKSSKRPSSEPKAAARPRHPIPEEVREALMREGLSAQYEARPPYQRNDYIGWIAKAKRPETKENHLRQMLTELRAGDAYMGMPYTGKKA